MDVGKKAAGGSIVRLFPADESGGGMPRMGSEMSTHRINRLALV